VPLAGAVEANESSAVGALQCSLVQLVVRLSNYDPVTEWACDHHAHCLFQVEFEESYRGCRFEELVSDVGQDGDGATFCVEGTLNGEVQTVSGPLGQVPDETSTTHGRFMCA